MTLLLAMVMFLQCLNTSLITVPLPEIADDLSISLSDSSWLLLAYSLATCALLLQFAKYSRNNRVRVFFIYGLIIFTMTSFVCGLARDFFTLGVLRLMQGGSIAMAAATGPILVVNRFPDEIKGSALGTMAAGTGLAMVLGPSLGGMLAEIISWHYLFWINIPLALATLAAAWWFIPKDDEPVDGKDPNIVGSIAWLIILALGLMLLENIQQWSNLAIAFSLMTILVCSLILALHLSEQSEEGAILTVDMLKNRSFLIIAASAMMGSMITEGAFYLLPYFMQISWNMDVMECGTYFCIVSVATLVAAKVIGKFCDNHSSLIAVVASFLSTIVFDIIFILIVPDWSICILILSACMVGMSFAIFETAQYLRMIRHTEHRYRDEAATMITVLTYVGASLGLIAYALCFDAAIPEAMGADIDELTAPLMTKGFHATGTLGLALGIAGLALALMVPKEEDL